MKIIFCFSSSWTLWPTSHHKTREDDVSVVPRSSLEQVTSPFQIIYCFSLFIFSLRRDAD